jgi:hypothetical protein
MWLSINETKVTELLKSSNKGYIVSTSGVPWAIENSMSAYPKTLGISGIVYPAPPLVTAETRNRLMSARRRIEESGVPLKSPEDLEREIGETRGRY